MANKKRMYKKGSFLEPSKELTFGGMKYQTGKALGSLRSSVSGTKPDKMDQIAQEAAARRGMSREEKFNTPQGSSAKDQRGNLKPRTESRPVNTTSGKPGVGRPLNQGTPKPTATKKAGEKGTYAYAKKRNPNLDKLIAERKKYDKGSAEYKKVQMQINDAYYGTGELRKPMEEVSIRQAGPIAPKVDLSNRKTIEAPKSAAKSEASSAKPADRRSFAPDSSAKSSSSASAADLKSQIKDAKAANRQGRKDNRQAAKISRLEERLAKLQNKKMEPGGLKPAPNKGAASLPKAVRNKMGFMKRGGRR